MDTWLSLAKWYEIVQFGLIYIDSIHQIQYMYISMYMTVWNMYDWCGHDTGVYQICNTVPYPPLMKSSTFHICGVEKALISKAITFTLGGLYVHTLYILYNDIAEHMC